MKKSELEIAKENILTQNSTLKYQIEILEGKIKFYREVA